MCEFCEDIAMNDYEYMKKRYAGGDFICKDECGRLMGVSDEDISNMAAVNSNTQLYKQFGNSIVVDAMCAMFKNLNIEQVSETRN